MGSLDTRLTEWNTRGHPLSTYRRYHRHRATSVCTFGCHPSITTPYWTFPWFNLSKTAHLYHYSDHSTQVHQPMDSVSGLGTTTRHLLTLLCEHPALSTCGMRLNPLILLYCKKKLAHLQTCRALNRFLNTSGDLQQQPSQQTSLSQSLSLQHNDSGKESAECIRDSYHPSYFGR